MPENAVRHLKVADYVERSGAVMFFRGPAETREQMREEFQAYAAIMRELGLID